MVENTNANNPVKMIRIYVRDRVKVNAWTHHLGMNNHRELLHEIISDYERRNKERLKL